VARKLTKTVVDSAVYSGDSAKKSRYVIWDTQLPGFGLRVFPGGRKSFVLSYRHNGRKRLMSLGTYGVETVDSARKKAKKASTLIDDEIDPLHERQQAAEADTLKEFAPVYLRRHAESKKKSASDDKLMLDNIIVPALGSLKLKAIKREDISRLHQKVGETINEKTKRPKTYQANRVLSLLSRMFTLAEIWGHVAEGHPNPCRGIPKFEEEERDRFIESHELPRVTKAIDKEKNKIARNAIWLYLLTGLRKSELLSLKWSDINFERKEIRLAETKAGRKHYLPLTSEAVELLQSIVRIEGNPYVLPGRRQGRHLVNIDKPWRRIRKAAGVEDIRLHDLRRTVGSWLAQSGNSLHLIGKILNHSSPQTTKRYARFQQDSLREAMESQNKRLMGVAGKRKSGEVIKING